MNCDRFDEAVDLLAAGELDAETVAAAETHAGQCPPCAARLEAARARLRALDGCLGGLGASEGLVERIMAAVRAEAVRSAQVAEEPRPERLRTRLLRAVAYAAAACLFALAGYSFLQRPAAARLRQGQMFRVGANAAQLAPGAAISHGEIVATPVDAKGPTRLDLAGGRLHAVLAPGSVLRLSDPRSGTLAALDRGELFWRVVGESGSPAIASPLARVQTGPGDFSLHVAPAPGEGEPGRFSGYVTLFAHSGGAQVQLAGRGPGLLTLKPGQVLALRSDPRRLVAQPLPFETVQKSFGDKLRELQTRWSLLDGLIAQVSREVRTAPIEAQLRLFRDAIGYQDEMRQVEMARGELSRRLDLLRHCHDQGKHIFRVVLQQAPEEP